MSCDVYRAFVPVQFRNYARLELGLPTNNPVVLHGQNAQGKTSLLGSIYYLATAKSPYNAADRQLIHWRAENDPIPFARLSAEICAHNAPMNRLEMTLMIERTVDGVARLRKVVKVNGVDKRVMDIVGLLNVVLFLPHDLSLVEGSPSDRRRFMDNTLRSGGRGLSQCHRHLREDPPAAQRPARAHQ
ncbi:MAG: hypothetical protein IPK17_39540 [Chloroflexi bacterium]|uniref:hypothetical protein n=1 Tax=Candidatus Flexifilum breve TaxID=3140694 RepID=UPI0031356FD9|nr:hypothetical protein [Chloroflexota bacterium]